ncbi:MAG: hypothetical protein LIO65_02180 [Odoribacter sp.]|nr:hypothetical protein [Odoribacter sp.]
MYIREGEVEWRVYNEKGEVLELPIAIQLNDFYMEEYPPKLAIINRETGAIQPENKPDYYQIDKNEPKGKLSEWDITLKEYIHEAVRNSDTTYQEIHMPGASPAAHITAHNRVTGEEKEGWVCAGNIAQLYMVLNLNDTYCVVMTTPEPKQFISDINVFTQDGKEAHTLLEVNKPLKLGN